RSSDLYRHWNGYKDGRRSHLFVTAVDSCGGDHSRASLDRTAEGGCPHMGTASAARDLTPGDHDAPPFHLGGQDMYAFSPDGQEICFTSNHDEDQATSTNNDLFTVPVNGGPAKNITADNKAADEPPLYSPDGRYIAYRAQARAGYESDRWRLMLYERNTGVKTNLTETFDHWVGSFGWAGLHEIFFNAENAGHSPIYSITPEICLDRCHP